MTLLSVLTTLFLTPVAFAGEIKISPSTPVITPSELIYQFPIIQWDVVETRQDSGKDNRDSVVMLCDDTNYSIVEIKLDYNFQDEKSPLDDVTIETDDCKFEGAYTNKFAPSWLHFSGPSKKSSCEVIIQKERAGGKTPLKMVFEIHDAC